MSAGTILLILLVLGLLVIGIGIGLGIMFAVPLLIGAVVLTIIVALVQGSPESLRATATMPGVRGDGTRWNYCLTHTRGDDEFDRCYQQ